jgi:hypothetical protein
MLSFHTSLSVMLKTPILCETGLFIPVATAPGSVPNR